MRTLFVEEVEVAADAVASGLQVVVVGVQVDLLVLE